jgi:hypothetical protein
MLIDQSKGMASKLQASMTAGHEGHLVRGVMGGPYPIMWMLRVPSTAEQLIGLRSLTERFMAADPIEDDVRKWAMYLPIAVDDTLERAIPVIGEDKMIEVVADAGEQAKQYCHWNFLHGYTNADEYEFDYLHYRKYTQLLSVRDAVLEIQPTSALFADLELLVDWMYSPEFEL